MGKRQTKKRKTRRKKRKKRRKSQKRGFIKDRCAPKVIE